MFNFQIHLKLTCLKFINNSNHILVREDKSEALLCEPILKRRTPSDTDIVNKMVSTVKYKFSLTAESWAFPQGKKLNQEFVLQLLHLEKILTRHRGLFGTDGESYIIDVHGKVGDFTRGASKEGKTEFRIGLLFDGHLSTFLSTNFGMQSLEHCLRIISLCLAAVEICQNVSVPQTLTDAAACALARSYPIPDYSPLTLKQTLLSWLTQIQASNFTNAMKRKPFIKKS